MPSNVSFGKRCHWWVDGRANLLHGRDSRSWRSPSSLLRRELGKAFPPLCPACGVTVTHSPPQNVEVSLTPYSLRCELGDPNPWPCTWSSWVLCYPPSEMVGLVSLPPGCDQPKSEHILLLLGTLRAWPTAWPKERGVNCESRSQSPPELLTASVWHWIHDFTANSFAQCWIYLIFLK